MKQVDRQAIIVPGDAAEKRSLVAGDANVSYLSLLFHLLSTIKQPPGGPSHALQDNDIDCIEVELPE
jgi:hypothetical protein